MGLDISHSWDYSPSINPMEQQMQTATIPAALNGHDSPAAQRQLSEHLERHTYDAAAVEVAAARSAVAAIKAVPGWAKTEAAYGHLLAVISAEISKSGWGHTDIGVNTQGMLDDLSDDLSKAGQS